MIMSMVMHTSTIRELPPFFRKILAPVCIMLISCLLVFFPYTYAEGMGQLIGVKDHAHTGSETVLVKNDAGLEFRAAEGAATRESDRLDCPDCGIDLVQVIPQGGNNLFDTTDPTVGGGTGGGTFNFALITTPPGLFHTSVAGQFGTCGAPQTSQVAFNGSTLALRPFYGNGGQIGFVSFVVSGNIATSTIALTIPGIPNESSICTLTPSNANTFVVLCRGNITASMCNDTWIRF